MFGRRFHEVVDGLGLEVVWLLLEGHYGGAKIERFDLLMKRTLKIELAERTGKAYEQREGGVAWVRETGEGDQTKSEAVELLYLDWPALPRNLVSFCPPSPGKRELAPRGCVESYPVPRGSPQRLFVLWPWQRLQRFPVPGHLG